jgi:hypothetical protein
VAIKAYLADGGLGVIIALIVLVLALVALLGGLPSSSTVILALIAGCALSRLT